MSQDARHYSQWSVTYHLETFWREVSKEYSANWEGPMIYDHIEMVSRVYENGNRWHVAHVKFTVGYTNVERATQDLRDDLQGFVTSLHC